MPGFNRIREFERMLEERKRRAIGMIGRFCLAHMDYYVAVDTGYLKSRNQWKEFQNGLRLFNDAYYAGYQELGTSRMKEHPFLKPSVFRHLSEIKDIMGRVYNI